MILDYSFAVQLNFSNFRNFGNKWFALFRILSQIVQVSQIRILQGFANTSFARICKYVFRFARFRKVRKVFATEWAIC